MEGFSKPVTTNEDGLPVRLILCVDGTGDTAKGSFSAIKGVTGGTEDSIKSIFDMIKAGPVEDASGNKFFQCAQYFEGIGTEGVSESNDLFVRVEALFDGATGFGYLDILRNAYKVCCEKLGTGGEDEIFVFGFSRGAFIVRALASFLQNVGLIKPEYLNKGDMIFEEKFYEVLRKYSDLTKKFKFLPQTNASKALLPFCKPSPRVRFVGVFDTVKTVIPLPVHNLLFHGIPDLDFEMDAPGIVNHFRHALALNEARPLFNPDLWKSDVDSSDRSYLEAWFFGYHHDIGGGADNQGLALWPLQWILNAAMDYGLVLDTAEPPYQILFSGKENVIIAHEMAIKMFDMIQYHGPTQNFALRLHEPSSLMPPEPRNYFKFLTAPPYLGFVKPKVFLHPSAYLIFDISSSFRIQVYGWKHFRSFLRDRPTSVLEETVPWWEEQTVESILKESTAVEHLNLLVYGPPGTGKLDLINRMFGQVFMEGSKSKTPLTETTAAAHGINTPLWIPGNDQVRIYYAEGIGAGRKDGLADMKKLLAQQKDKTLEDQIHAVWYFIDASEDEIEASEKQFFGLDFGDIPVIAILENEDQLKNSLKRALTDNESHDQSAIQKLLDEAILKKIKQLGPLPLRSYVHAQNSAEIPKDLVRVTSLYVKDESVQIAQIKAQRIAAKPIVALATEESIRAYTIWHSFKFSGEEIRFRRNKDDGKDKLTWMLMEPVLATFNMRFPGDNAQIQELVGSAWSKLDHYKSGLCDKSLPGDLILMCMLDTIIVLTHALSHQHIAGKEKSANDFARPLSKHDIEEACAWYTSATNNRQVATHGIIKSLLSEEDRSPKNKSIAHLQMKLIETVELESDNAEKATLAGLIGGAIQILLGGKEKLSQGSQGLGSLTKGFL